MSKLQLGEWIARFPPSSSSYIKVPTARNIQAVLGETIEKIMFHDPAQLVTHESPYIAKIQLKENNGKLVASKIRGSINPNGIKRTGYDSLPEKHMDITRSYEQAQLRLSASQLAAFGDFEIDPEIGIESLVYYTGIGLIVTAKIGDLGVLNLTSGVDF